MTARVFTLLALLLTPVISHAQSVVVSNLWSIAAGTRDYMTTNATERGVAINPVTGNILLVSSAGGVNVVIIDPDTGEDKGRLNTGDITGTNALNVIGVAEDGVIYAANLVTSASEASPLRIYRWQDERATPTLAYSGVPGAGLRLGDSFDLRGAGTNTQIAMGTAGASSPIRFMILASQDGTNFTATGFATTGISAGFLQKGIVFGATNTLYGTVNGQGVRQISFDLTTGSSTLIRSIFLPASSAAAIAVDATNAVLFAVHVNGTNAHKLGVYDISNPSLPFLTHSIDFPMPKRANSLAVGAIDLQGHRLIALDTQNGLLAQHYTIDPAPVPPSIITHPVSLIALEGARPSMSVTARGTPPLTYFWYKEETNFLRASTSTFLSFSALTISNAGLYSVVVSNIAGTTRSANATLTVNPVVRGGRLAPSWSIAPRSRPYIGTDNLQRGLAFNPVTTNLLVVSGTLGQTNIYVLDALTGADKYRLAPTNATGGIVVSNGTTLLNLVGVADDGVVYACNIGNTTTGADFKIYRWANDAPETLPTVAYGPNNPGLGGRCGDTFDVRGSGVNTQILVGSRNGTTVAIFTTTDGLSFSPNVFVIADATPGNFGLGLVFGPGNTFYGKSFGTNFPLRLVEFDLDTAQTRVRATFQDVDVSANVAVIGFDPINRFLAGVSVETPDNIRLFGVTNELERPVLLHQEFFPTDNANGNATGAVDFGAGYLFALDTNNGLVAHRLFDPNFDPVLLTVQARTNAVVLTWPIGTLQSATNLLGPWLTNSTARSPFTNTFGRIPRTYWRVAVP